MNNTQSSSRKPKVVVYTAITGNYDKLIAHTHVSKDFDYVFFYDGAPPKADKHFWEFRPQVAFQDPDPNRQAKYYKLMPHRLFPDYDYSVWVDGNWDIRGPHLENAVKTFISSDIQISPMPHYERNCIYDEADICLAHKKDDPKKIKSWLEHIKKNNYPSNNGLFHMAVMIRRHNDPEVIELMEMWWSYIQQFSRRDQLSFCFSLSQTNVKCETFFGSADLSPSNGHTDYSVSYHRRQKVSQNKWHKKLTRSIRPRRLLKRIRRKLFTAPLIK